MTDTPEPASLFDRMGGRKQILHLLRHFYADVRQHQLIGPLFNAQIEDWPSHLEKIADFWSNVTGGPIRYGGPMPSKHLSLGLTSEHFEVWLDLWQRNCQIHLNSEESAELSKVAREIGERLQFILSRNQQAIK